MPQVGQDELPGGAVGRLDRGAGLRVDQLGVNEPAGAEVHPVLLLALTPQRGTDVPDAHGLRHPRTPAGFELSAEGRFTATRLARNEHAVDARPGRSKPRSAAHSTR